jgi:hypothetical protein
LCGLPSSIAASLQRFADDVAKAIKWLSGSLVNDPVELVDQPLG